MPVRFYREQIAGEKQRPTLHLPGIAPIPVTNADFTRILAGMVRRPAVFPTPAFVLRLVLGEFAEVLLASQRAMPQAAQRGGYRFLYPELRDALRSTVAEPAAEAPRSATPTVSGALR